MDILISMHIRHVHMTGMHMFIAIACASSVDDSTSTDTANDQYVSRVVVGEDNDQYVSRVVVGEDDDQYVSNVVVEQDGNQ